MSATLESLGELRIAERIRSRLGNVDGIEIGPGDDAAVVRASSDRVVLTVDTQREGVHFRRGWLSASDLGRRALAVAASDLAAMAARPVCALCSLVLPPATSIEWLDDLLDGLAEGGAEFACPVVGGDVSQPAAAVSLCMTAVGSLAADERPARRDGAAAGDLCVIVGELGYAAAGRDLLATDRDVEGAGEAQCVEAYRRPVPLLAAGRAIAAHASALMDVSDGLSLDLARMCAASGVGAELDGAVLADPKLATIAGRLGADASRWVLAGGDDYALMAAVPEDSWPAAESAVVHRGARVRVVGRFEAERGLRLRDRDGVTGIDAAGWDPFGRGAR